MQFLIAQSTYDEIQVGLFNDLQQVDQQIISKFDACKHLILTTRELLARNNTSFAHVSFIGVNLGPAPFNTLRVLISSLNGIAFATNIPLVGVDGLKALYTSSRAPQTVVLLNAFNQEVYFAYKKQPDLVRGVARVDEIIPAIMLNLPHGPITFIGNGAVIFKKQILEAFGSRALVPEPTNVLSLETLAQICVNKFNQDEKIQYATPLYLKRAVQKNI